MPCPAPELDYYAVPEDRIELTREDRESILNWFEDEDAHLRKSEVKVLQPAELISIGPALEYEQVLEAVDASESILSLRDNWDSEGSIRYEEHTWKRAMNFLLLQASLARNEFYEMVGLPTITPADNGSIDIYWASEERDLLLNIPSETAKLGTYYGENSRGETISGILNPETARPDLVAWLITN